MDEKRKDLLVGFYNYTVILTYIGAAAGLLGVCAAAGGSLSHALLCLLIAGGCDLFDGMIARTRERTAQEKRFGIQIDSLADLISFGVLPAAIGYRLGLQSGGLVLLCVYTLCALIRLAYYNVTEDELQIGAGEKRVVYEGLPVTTAALIMPLAAIVQILLPWRAPYLYAAAMLLVLLAFVLRFRVPKLRLPGMIVMALLGLAELVVVLFYL